MVSSAGRSSGGTAPFDPATLDLTMWARADYVAGNPWGNTASAGISGGEQLDVGSNPPAQANGILGPSLEYDVADFDGTNDNMLSENVASTYITTTNSSGWSLVYVETIGTNSTSGSRLDNDCIFGTNGTTQHGVFLRSGGGTPQVGLQLFDGSANRIVETGITLNAWQLVQWRTDGSTVEIRVNGGSWASSTGGTQASVAAALRVGRNPFDDQWLDGRMAEFALSKQKFDDATFDSILEYNRTRYDLSL